VGSVVRIQRVWRKSLPVIRRKEELLRFLARSISCTSRNIVVGPRFRRIWNQGFAPNPCRNLVSSPGLQSLILVISHLAQLRVTHSPRSGLGILGPSGFAPLAFARSAQPHCGSPMLAATSQASLVRCKSVSGLVYVFARRPGAQSVREIFV
jgi:hypothetical protein